MLDVPGMVIIGGNTRNSGKTTMACSIIKRFSTSQEVIGLKVTALRPGENKMHGDHSGEDLSAGFSIVEELNPDSGKDTSKMLRAGATRVYYICVSELFIEEALLHFIAKYINNQLIVCESRSLRQVINPGFFVMMMRIPAEGKTKERNDQFLSLADKVFYFDEDQPGRDHFVAGLQLENDKITSENR